MKTILIIGTGGFIGSICRYLLHKALTHYYPAAFPMGTLAANMAGCLLIGVVYGLATKANFMAPEWRMFLAVGFCGSFTTFSTFAYENLQLLEQNAYLTFFIYTFISLAGGILLALSGIWIANLLASS